MGKIWLVETVRASPCLVEQYFIPAGAKREFRGEGKFQISYRKMEISLAPVVRFCRALSEPQFSMEDDSFSRENAKTENRGVKST